MVQVRGTVHDVSDNPDRVEKIIVRAVEPRMHGTTYITEEPTQFPVVDGVLDFNVLPGPCVVAFLRNHGATTYEKLLVPDAAEATFKECLDAADLAEGATKATLENAVRQVQEELSKVAPLVNEVRTLHTEVSNDRAAADGFAKAAQKSASDAATSQSKAKTSETNAANSAASAKSQQESAKTHFNNTVKEAEKAANSATAAKTSETNANKHRQAAATSESNAATHKTNAGESAAAAASSAAEAKGHADRAEVASDPEGLRNEMTKQFAALVDGAPEDLDTIREIAEYAQANRDVTDQLNAAIGNKANKSHTHEISEVNGLAEHIDSRFASIPPIGRSLFSDPSFEDGTDRTAVEVPDARSGKFVARLNAWRWSAGGYHSQIYTGGLSRHYAVSYWVRGVNIPEDYEGTATVGLRFRRLDGSGEYIGEHYPPASGLVRLRSLSGGEWVHHTATFDVDSPQEYLTPYFVVSGDSVLTDAHVDIDDVFVADVTDSDRIDNHTHSQSDITDATDKLGRVSDYGTANKLVRTNDEGQLTVYTSSVTKDASVANKNYVDIEVAKKADKSHKHVTADITDSTDWINHPAHPNKMVRTREDGFVHGNSPTADRHVATKGYVDEEVAKKANTSHKHTTADITDFATEMGKKANTSHTHTQAQVTGLSTALNGKADKSHTHTTSQVSGLDAALDGKADKSYVNSRPALFSGTGAPPSSIAGAVAGDFWLNTTTMELHKITGV